MRRVGIDLAVRVPHTAIVVDGDEQIGGAIDVSHDAAGFSRLLEVASRGCSEPIDFIMERTSHAWWPLARFLEQSGHRVLLTSGQVVASCRKIISPGAKTDLIDAYTLTRIPLVAPKVLSRFTGSAARIALARAVKHRMRLSDEITQHKLRISSALEIAIPVLAGRLEILMTVYGRKFLREYVDPTKATTEGEARFTERLAANKTSEKSARLFFRACKQAAELHEKSGGDLDLAGLQDEVDIELDIIESLEKAMTRLERRIEDLYRRADPKRVLLQLPGIGAAIAPALEAFIGDIRRFPSAKHLVSYCGLCPRVHDSGTKKSKGLAMTKRGSSVLKRYLYIAADVARQHDLEFAAAYARLRDAGKHPKCALIALANKLVRRVHALLLKREQEGDTSWERRDEDRRKISGPDAQIRLRRDYPSKAERERREKARAEAALSGQSEDSATSAHRPSAAETTIGDLLGPTIEALAEYRAARSPETPRE